MILKQLEPNLQILLNKTATDLPRKQSRTKTTPKLGGKFLALHAFFCLDAKGVSIPHSIAQKSTDAGLDTRFPGIQNPDSPHFYLVPEALLPTHE